ncbi:MAG: alpha/beta hydrolase [Patescibacteria group bacterium]
MSSQYLTQKALQTKNGKIIYYADISFPERPTVFLLHGLASNHTTWLNIMDFLHSNKYNSIAPDLRGHGFSDKTKNKKLYELSIFSADLLGITKQENVSNLVLVGYSFGGGIAIDYADRYPEHVNGLVLISVNHKEPLQYVGLKFLTPVVSGFFNLAAALLSWQKRANYHYYKHGKIVGYWDSVQDGLRTMPISVNFWMLAQTFRIDLEDAIRRIKVPTTIVYGKRDAFVTRAEIDDMTQAMPGAEVVVSNNSSHFVSTNSQNETAEIVINFLKNHENSHF